MGGMAARRFPGTAVITALIAAVIAAPIDVVIAALCVSSITALNGRSDAPPGYTRSRPCLRSARMSSGVSSPTDNRSKPSDSP